MKTKCSYQPVGKKIGDFVWFHISYMNLMLEKSEIEKVLSIVKDDLINIDIIRLSLKDRKISLISCLNFDSSNEPSLSSIVDLQSSKMKIFKKNPPIFHQKHLMVMKDYKGFCYDEIEKRTVLWKSLVPDDKGFYLRIGRRDYWNKWLSSVGIEL